jgi:hypothetical protein
MAHMPTPNVFPSSPRKRCRYMEISRHTDSTVIAGSSCRHGTRSNDLRAAIGLRICRSMVSESEIRQEAL